MVLCFAKVWSSKEIMPFSFWVGRLFQVHENLSFYASVQTSFSSNDPIDVNFNKKSLCNFISIWISNLQSFSIQHAEFYTNLCIHEINLLKMFFVSLAIYLVIYFIWFCTWFFFDDFLYGKTCVFLELRVYPMCFIFYSGFYSWLDRGFL